MNLYRVQIVQGEEMVEILIEAADEDTAFRIVDDLLASRDETWVYGVEQEKSDG